MAGLSQSCRPVPTYDHYVSFAELAAAGVTVRPLEAVTIVRELALRVARGELPGVPSAHVVRLFASGIVSVEGPIAADSRAVARAAHLLDTLLPPFNAPAEPRVPGALRLVLARALGSLDLPPYSSLDSFAEALSRFGSEDPEGTVRALVARHSLSTTASRRAPRAPALGPEGSADVYQLTLREGSGTARRREPSPLTISDIRRARRATGLTLAEISERSHISQRLLRELEWGYLRNWPGAQAGRNQLLRYAHATGLDDEIVVRTVWPLLEECERGARGHLDRDHPARTGYSAAREREPRADRAGRAEHSEPEQAAAARRAGDSGAAGDRCGAGGVGAERLKSVGPGDVSAHGVRARGVRARADDPAGGRRRGVVIA